MMTNKPIVSVVLGTYNRFPFLKLTIDSIRRELSSLPHEIIVVDGGSADGTLKWLVKQKDIITIIQHNRGKWRGNDIERKSWGYFMNLGFKSTQSKYICMLSDDCLAVPGAIRNGLELFEKKLTDGDKLGAVAFYWRNWPEDEKYFVIAVNGHIYVNQGIYLKSALEEVGFIDEENYKFYDADVDLCFKLIQAKYLIIPCENSIIEHYNHANIAIRNTNTNFINRDTQVFMKKWSNFLDDKDPRDCSSLVYLKKVYNNDSFVSYYYTKSFLYLSKVKFFLLTLLKK